MDVLTRLQDWYKINCDGDWEHSYGVSLTTIDNPGWHLIVNLSDTALENLQYAKQYQNEGVEDDWFQMKVENQNLEVYCGPDNLRLALLIFLDEIIPKLSDPKYAYDIYLPVSGFSYKIWFPAKGKLISESTLELIEIPKINYQDLKVQNLDFLNFSEANVPELKHQFLVGERVQVTLEQMFDGVKLVVVNK